MAVPRPGKLGVPVDVTLCDAPEEGAHVQVTLPPTVTVSTARLLVMFRTLRKLLSRTVTSAVVGIGAGSAAVAVKVTGDPSSPSLAAVIVIGPAVPPSVTTTSEIPLPSVRSVETEGVAPIAAQFTPTPATGFPNSSVTLVWSGSASAVLISPVCPVPSTSSNTAASPATAAALKVTVDPGTPATAAAAVCVPEVVPRVQLLLATPLASVAVEVGLRAPPAVAVDQFTVTPGVAAPSVVTVT